MVVRAGRSEAGGQWLPGPNVVILDTFQVYEANLLVTVIRAEKGQRTTPLLRVVGRAYRGERERERKKKRKKERERESYGCLASTVIK